MYARFAGQDFGKGRGKRKERLRHRIVKAQVGTGDRSERIRTYNYPQGRVTEHRIGLTLHKLDIVLNGEMDELLDALLTAKQSEQLQQVK